MSSIYIACKKSKESSDSGNVVLKAGKKLEISVKNHSGENARYPLDPCLTHGGSIGVGVSWELATCRSNCERGIGFRCGRETYVICRDGETFPISQNLGNCPGKQQTVITYTYRKMDGLFEFYNNNTVKIIFTKAMISEEANNTTFEIEGNEDIELPEYLLIGGNSYSTVRLLQNNYQINYSDGEFGSVVIAASYIQ